MTSDKTPPSPAGLAQTHTAAVIVSLIVAGIALLGFWMVRKVRVSSEDKLVITNMRQLDAAAAQYYLENAVTSVVQSQLVGPTNYIKHLTIYAGEVYPTTFTKGVTITVTGVGGARTSTYAP